MLRILLDEEHVQALSTCTRTDCEVILDNVEWTPRSLPALVECIHANAGPTKIIGARGTHLPGLTSGLSGNSRVTYLSMEWGGGDLQFPLLCPRYRGIGENLGLLELTIDHGEGDYEGVILLVGSLKCHTTLKTLNLDSSFYSLASKRGLVDMLRDNKVLETVGLQGHANVYERDEGIYENEILPCLERNRFIPRVTNTERTRPESLRRKVLGRSFSSIQGNTNLIWMFLSGNVDVAFPSKEELAGKRKRVT